MELSFAIIWLDMRVAYWTMLKAYIKKDKRYAICFY
jgi:hypothetical protein